MRMRRNRSRACFCACTRNPREFARIERIAVQRRNFRCRGRKGRLQFPFPGVSLSSMKPPSKGALRVLTPAGFQTVTSRGSLAFPSAPSAALRATLFFLFRLAQSRRGRREENNGVSPRFSASFASPRLFSDSVICYGKEQHSPALHSPALHSPDNHSPDLVFCMLSRPISGFGLIWRRTPVRH